MRKIVLILGVLVAFWVVSLARIDGHQLPHLAWPGAWAPNLNPLPNTIASTATIRRIANSWAIRHYLLDTIGCNPAVNFTQSTIIELISGTGISGVSGY